MTDDIEERIELHYEPLKGKLLERWQRTMPQGAHFYPLDLFITGIAHRALRLTDGFMALIKSRNFITAAPLVRVQLDSALRLFAATLVQNPNDFASKVLGGERIDKMKDAKGERLRDGYLAERLNEQFGWVKSVYDKTSGFVHFSEEHIFLPFSMTDEDRTLQIAIGGNADSISLESYIEAIEAFAAATEIVIFLMDSWIEAKSAKNI